MGVKVRCIGWEGRSEGEGEGCECLGLAGLGLLGAVVAGSLVGCWFLWCVCWMAGSTGDSSAQFGIGCCVPGCR